MSNNISEASDLYSKTTAYSTVVSRDARYPDGEEPQRMTKHKVEGKLAEDVRHRLNADADEEVFITSVEQDYWISDLTAESTFKMNLECGQHVKVFDEDTGAENFSALLNWLDELL